MMSFDEIVIDKFKFLENEYSFIVSKRRTDSVEYESDSVEICIVYDSNRSYEVDIYVGLKNEITRGISYNFDEVLRVFDISLDIGPSHQDSRSLKKYLKVLSQILNSECVQVLNGKKDVFKDKKWSINKKRQHLMNF